ncbi:MAG: tetratricopeptide repeat protein [Rhodobacteraceae bacterium]|nr:tetratricopeptide repeat protein [Paracoccaceae bacterium]
MSNPDSFIAEVTEEVRRDRLFALFRRYGWIAVLAVLLVVGGASWHEWQKARERAAAEAFGDAVLAALRSEDPAARAAALAAVPAEGGRGAVKGLLGAAAAVAAGDKPAALALLAAVAGDATLPASYRALATLKRVILGGTDLALAERETALAPLAAAGAPFRTLVLEQQALLRLEAGDTAAAAGLLRQALEATDITAGERRRLTQLMVAIGAPPAGAG